MILPSDRHRAALALDSYSAARVPAFALGKRSLPRVFLDRDEDGGLVSTWEGTRPKILGDWRADFDQLDLEIDATCDPVPHGWGAAVLAVIFRMFAEIPADVALGFGGHSMGASNALIAARLWKLAGRKRRRITAFEPGPVGRLDGALSDEDILITCVGDVADSPWGSDPFHRDPVPWATGRGHPAPLTWLPSQPRWTIADMHEMENVSAALDARLRIAA